MPEVADPARRARLQAWLSERLGAPDLEITDLDLPRATGFSTETAYIDVAFSDGGRRHRRQLVARFESRAPGLFLDADITLQWNMISAMARHPGVPTPRPFGLELDRNLFGAAFSVVERVAGRAVPQAPNYNLSGWLCDLAPDHRRTLWRNGLEAMAKVHKVDWRDGFAFLARPQAGLTGLDQLLDWTRRWYDWARREARHPLIEQALEQLAAERPARAPDNVLWGDAAPTNILFQDDLSVGAVLDWEVAALGPGETDLAWWLFYDAYMSEGFGIARLEGLPTREETIEIYQAALGRPVDSIEYYELLAHARNAILSMRSVNRQVDLGRIDATTTATTHNPISRLLAKALKVEPAPVGCDYDDYLKAVLSAKAAPADG